jgi:hypothetical protein
VVALGLAVDLRGQRPVSTRILIATLTSGGGPGFLMKKEIGVNPALISSTTFLAFIRVSVFTALVVINPAASAYASRLLRLTASFLAASNFAVSSRSFASRLSLRLSTSTNARYALASAMAASASLCSQILRVSGSGATRWLM